MAGNKKWNSDLDLLGKMKINTVPNNTGTVLTYNAASKEISTRTNAQIIDDLGLITATNIASAYYTKAQLQTSGQAQVHWGNITDKPTTFPATAHNHDDRYYTETESDNKYVPYTGATKSVDLNNKTLFNVNALAIGTSSIPQSGNYENGVLVITTPRSYHNGLLTTTGLDVRTANGASMAYPLSVSGIGNGGVNRGVGIQFNVAYLSGTTPQSSTPLARLGFNPTGTKMITDYYDGTTWVASKYFINFATGLINSDAGFSKTGGTASQFLKADGSVDSNSYALSSHTHSWSDITSGKPTTISGYGITDAYTKTEVDAKVASTFKPKGSVANFAALPTTGQQEGDVWNLLDTGKNVVWVLNLNNTGNPGWDDLSGTVDLSGYALQSWVTANFSGINHTHSWSQITDKPTFATVATTGNYSDLNGTPTIPTVNNGTLTLGTGTGLSGSATFGANQGTASTFTVGIASGYKLPTTTEWNSKYTLPTGGTTSQYVRGDGTLATFPTIPQGTVTSVEMTVPTGLSVTGSPITNSGTLALSYATGYQGYTTTEATKLAGIAAGADNYGSWNLKTNGTQRTTVTSGGTLDLVAGSNVSLSYSAGGVVTINSTDTVYTHPTTSGNKHIPAGGSAGQILRWSADGTAVWGAENNTTYSVYSGSTAGLVKARDAGNTTTKFLNETGNWVVPPNTTYPVFAGTSTAGLVPARVGSTTTKYLREDGTWTTPPNTSYSSGIKDDIDTDNPEPMVWSGEELNNKFEDYIRTSHAVNSITTTNITNWNTAYTNSHTHSNKTVLDGISLTNVTNWNTAYGWGNHASAGYLTSSSLSGYALDNGSNATGSWANSSNGLENNPTLPGKTLNGSVTTSLQDANNGSIAGYLNSAGVANGNPDANWWYRLKMLHPNPAGYNGEIAVQMTGGNSLRYRKTENGYNSGWIETVDQNNVIVVRGKKMFYTSGNNYNDVALEAYSDNAAAPAIAFHKAGQYAGSIAMTNSHLFQFRDLAGTSLVHTQVSISHALNGFVHQAHNSADKVLTSNGGAIHKEDLVLPLVIESQTVGDYIDLHPLPEFREIQVIVMHSDVIVNLPDFQVVKGAKIIIKSVDSAGPVNVEFTGNFWGTAANDDNGCELLATELGWVHTLIGRSELITL